ncbi:LOW QUALITY PROTEIN: serine protease-like protein 51 [Rhynchonycteris naso]
MLKEMKYNVVTDLPFPTYRCPNIMNCLQSRKYGAFNMYLQKQVVQVSWRDGSKRVDQLSRSMLCVWKEADSGTPMICATCRTRLFQVGIFSWGVRSGLRGRPGMLVSVAQFIPCV